MPALPLPQSFVVEMGYTGLLGFVIMAVATDPRAQPAVAPFAIGAAIFAGALVTGPLTGGSFNPARSLGPAVVGGIWTAHWLYWAAPILGMAAGMRLYIAVGAPETESAASGGALGTEGPIDRFPRYLLRASVASHPGSLHSYRRPIDRRSTTAAPALSLRMTDPSFVLTTSRSPCSPPMTSQERSLERATWLPHTRAS